MIDQFSSNAREPLVFLLSGALKSINFHNFIKTNQNIKNDPDKWIKISLLEDSYNSVKNYYEINTLGLGIDHSVQVLFTLGVMTNKKINLKNDIIKQAKENPETIMSFNDKVPMSYLTIPFRLISNTKNDPSFTLAGMAILRNIYEKEYIFLESIEAYEEDRYEEYRQQLLQRLKSKNSEQEKSAE